MKFNAGTLSLSCFNFISLPLLDIREYSKFSKFCTSAVSNAKLLCLAPIGKAESVKTTLAQCDKSLILSQFSISDKYIIPIP